MLKFIEHIFDKKEPEDLKLFKNLRKQAHQELKFLEDYFEHYKYKVKLVANFRQLWDAGRINELSEGLEKVTNFIEEDASKQKLVKYIVVSLADVKGEYSQLNDDLKGHTKDITEYEQSLMALEQKEYQNLANLFKLLNERMKPNIEKQKELLSVTDIPSDVAKLGEITALVNEEGKIIEEVKNVLAELTVEIVESIKLTEIPVDVRIPGSANVLTGFKDSTGTYLEKRSGGDKYPGKGVLIEQRSEYAGVLFSNKLDLSAPELKLEPMTKEEMEYVNTHDFVSDKENLSKVIYAKRMTVKYISNVKPLFDIRGEVDDAMRNVDPGYLFAFPPKSQRDMVVLFFLDVFISNYDRHGKNIMIDSDNRIHPIDPAMGFNTVDFKAKGFKGAYGYKFGPKIEHEHWESFLFNTFTRYVMCVQTGENLAWVYDLLASKLSDGNIKEIIDEVYRIRPHIEFLPGEMSLYASANNDLPPEQMVSILASRRDEILNVLKNWDTFSRDMKAFDYLFTDYLKRGKAFGTEFIPKHCTFRDHALIRKVFYDNKAPISRQEALKEYMEEKEKRFSADDVVKEISTGYSASHEEPCALETKIRAEHVQALRQRDQAKRNILSVVLTDIRYAEHKNAEEQIKKIDFRKRMEALKTIKVKLKEAEIVSIVKSLVKKNNELLKNAKKASRQDVIKSCEYENAVLYDFLPRQLSDEELENLVRKTIAENPGVENPGQIIRSIMTDYKGQVDGKKVNVLVNKLLQGK